MADRISGDHERPRALIFESYGWGDAVGVAGQIKASLEEAGYSVWIDRENLPPDEKAFSIPLQMALEKSNLVVALLSPHSVRLTGDVMTATHGSWCHNELIFADQSDKPIVAVKVFDCVTPLAINHYDVIDFTKWQSTDSYSTGMQEILSWIDQGLAFPPHRHYCIYVDNLPRSRLHFPEELTAAGTFVGREWLINDRLDAWFDSDSKCLLIEAEPGSGKTALVAELVRRNPGDRILAYHFCSLRSAGTIDPQKFVRSVAAMLCGSIPEYRQILRDKELVRELQLGDPANMLREGILAPLREVRTRGVGCLVIDGLDEAVASPAYAASSSMSIPRLLWHALDAFPVWLKLVVTTRRDDRILGLFHNVTREFLGETVAAQRDDLRQYIEQRVVEPELKSAIESSGWGPRRVANAIAERAAGNFQYATMVLDELGRSHLSVDKINQLPKSLGGLFGELADLRFPYGAGFESGRKVLSVLLVAQQPLTLAQLALITGLDRFGALRDTIDKLSCFLTWDGTGNERVYRLAHKSIHDWLIDSNNDRFQVDKAQGVAMMLAHCRAWASNKDRYAATYLIAHVLDSGAIAEALALVRGGFFDQRRDIVNRRQDLDDTLRLVQALIVEKDQAAILELARTENTSQRDGVAAALAAPRQASAPDATEFVDRVVDALLRVR